MLAENINTLGVKTENQSNTKLIQVGKGFVGSDFEFIFKPGINFGDDCTCFDRKFAFIGNILLFDDKI